MNERATIRFLGAGLREHISSHYRVHGPDFGYKLAQRLVAEVAAEVIEEHGRRIGYAFLMRAADRVVYNRLLEEEDAPLATILEGEEATPAIRAKLIDMTADAGPAVHYDAAKDALIFERWESPTVVHRKLLRCLKDADDQRRAAWPRWRRILYQANPPGWWWGFVVGAALFGYCPR
jgi:hypothetical protein